MLKALWSYRYFIFSSVKNDFLIRFSQSKLGTVWVVLNPLFQVLIYSLALSNIMRARILGIDSPFSFALYLMSGILAWSLFSEIIEKSLRLFIENAVIIKKVNFPKVSISATMLCASLLNNFFLLVSIIFIFALIGHTFTINLLFILLLASTTAIFAFSIGLILGILNVFIRDIGQITPIFLQILFWFTPIVYPENIIPEKFISYIKLNPLYSIVTSYHNVLLYGKTPNIESLFYLWILSLILMLIGLKLFRKASPEMADVL